MTVENKMAEQCSGCAACVAICPKKCISMQPDNEGFLYPIINKDQCVSCGLCEKNCPFANSILHFDRDDKEVIGAYSNINDERAKSSSGGIFSLIAKNIISQGGVIFGVSMSKDCKSCHFVSIDKYSDIEYLRGSKYFQAEVNNTYFRVKTYLEDNKSVLFSGTPCQVSGLYAYLGKDYNNLLTVDIVCHGVPSQLLWKKYIENEEFNSNAKINKVNFRAKNISWEKFGLEEVFTDNSIKFEDLSKNFYLQLFLNNYCLRPSCYECKTKRTADITLGDLWGSEEMFPQIFEKDGTSLVLVNTEKGKKYFKNISSNISYCNVNYEDVIKMNPCIETSVNKPALRDVFYRNLEQYSFEKFQKKYNRIMNKQKRDKSIESIIYYSKRALIEVRNICKKIVK